jgi:hypothetical protein
MQVFLSKQLGKAPSEISSWPLPDIVMLMASYYEESRELEKQQKEGNS